MGTTVVADTFSNVATTNAEPGTDPAVRVVTAAPLLAVVNVALPKVPNVVVKVTSAPFTA